MLDYTPKDIERFWSKVNKNGSIHPYDASLGRCWEWMASRSKKGYGHFCLSGKCWQSHRLSWYIAFNNIPDKIMVLHSCDNRCCVNPDHLSLGTNDDNMKDMVKKGRQGIRVVHRKLTYEQAEEIRQRYEAEGVYQFELAFEYGVCQRTINNIIHRRVWP